MTYLSLRGIAFPASLIAALLTSASAQTTPPQPAAEDSTITLPAFTIESETETGYAATNATSATRIATDLKKLPVSLDIITEDLFKDYGLTEVYDILGLSSGVSNSQRASGASESYTVRGFTTFFTARNGNTNLRSFDSANVARVEVVNGPASVLYGQIDPGGVANTVTKQPSARASSNLRLEVGSWAYFRAELGTTGPLNKSKTLTYRVDGSWLDREGYRDYDSMIKRFVAPVIRWQPRKGTSATLDLEYVDMNIVGLGNWLRYTDRVNNVVKFDDTILPDTWSAQGPGLGTNVANRLYSLTLEHAITDRIVIRNQSGVSSFRRNNWENGSTATTPTVTTPVTLPWSRGLGGAFANGQTFANTLNLAARFDFGQRHYTRIVAGWDYNYVRNDTNSRTTGIVGGVGVLSPPNWNLANPATWDRTVPSIYQARVSAYSGTKVWEDKIYVVDALSLFNERLMFLGGMNYSKVHVLSLNYLTNGRLRIKPEPRYTPQLGAVWRVTPALGLYVNMSESFRQISSLRTNQDRSLTPFDPLIAEGLDYGVKYDFGDGRYSGQVTMFDIRYTNARQSFNATDEFGTYSYELQVGETGSKGAEFRLSANVTKNWQVVGGYTYVDAKVTKNPANATIIGRTLPRSPTHTATVNTSFRFTRGPLKNFSTGANIGYRSQAKAFETPDPFLLDPRVVINGRIGYAGKIFGRNANYNLLISNLTDEVYYPSSLGRADPISYRFSVDYRF